MNRLAAGEMKSGTMRTRSELRHDNGLEVASDDFAYLSDTIQLWPLRCSISLTFSPRRAAASASSGANPASTAAPTPRALGALAVT